MRKTSPWPTPQFAEMGTKTLLNATQEPVLGVSTQEKESTHHTTRRQHAGEGVPLPSQSPTSSEVPGPQRKAGLTQKVARLLGAGFAPAVTGTNRSPARSRNAAEKGTVAPRSSAVVATTSFDDIDAIVRSLR